MIRWLFCLWAVLLMAPASLRAGDLDNGGFLDSGILRIHVNRVTEKFPEQFRVVTATNFSSLVLDLRFAEGNNSAASAAASMFAAGKFPLIILVNRQTRGAAGLLATQLQAARTGIVIGGTNSAVSPDISLLVNPALERSFVDNPYLMPATNSLAALSVTNALLPFVDRMSEAELVRRKIKDGEDEGSPAPAPRAEPATPVIRDPALARAVDLLKALAVLKQARG